MATGFYGDGIDSRGVTDMGEIKMTTRRSAGILLLLLPVLLLARAFAFEPTATVKVTPVLKTTTSWDGKLLQYPAGQAEVSGMIIEIAPGGETGWHKHAAPSFGMLLDGELEVQLKDGATKRIRKGESIAEVVDTFHNGRNVGAVPVRILVFYAGAVGQSLTIKESSP